MFSFGSSFSYDILVSIFSFLKNCLRIERIIVLLVFMAISNIETACLSISCDYRPARPHQTLQSNKSLRNGLRILANRLINLVNVIAFQRPFLTV